MIIAYASGNSAPISNPSIDPSILLSSVTPPINEPVQVYGDAVDTNDPNATFTWQWTILDPQGVTLADPTSQNVTVNVTAWHNVRLHLVATNASTGETSETNILLAPSASFCDIRVYSERRSIELPAKGTRDWHQSMSVWANAIENSLPVSAGVNDLADVSTATGAQVDQLVGGGVATHNGSTLHTHTGAQVAEATDTTQGVVVLEAAVTNGTIPKVLVQERLAYTQASDISLDPNNAGAFSDKIIVHSNGSGSMPHVVFQATEAVTITDLSITLLDSGVYPTDYEFDLCIGSESQLQTQTMQEQGLSLSGVTTSHHPMVINHTLTGTLPTVSAGSYFGVVVVNSPTDNADAGRSLRVTIRAVREIN
jgi:hypothetical protein